MSSKTYLITGAAGFIGARFVETCQARGISVISVDEKLNFKTRTEIRGLHYGQEIDLNDLFDWLPTHPLQLDAIIHLGAISDTRESNLEHLQRLNVDYSKNLWNYATAKKIPFIYASSAATYGDGAQGYDDDEQLISQLKPLNAYGESKRTFDLWALDQEKKGNHPPSWAGFKFFNVYGFGERHKGFMSSVVLHSYDQILKTGKVVLFKSHREGIADGYQKRDFVSVEDVNEVIHFALHKPIRRGIFNLGTGQARPFIDLARSVFQALRVPENLEFIDTPLSIRDKYQYFTEAKMDRLRSEGYQKPFLTLEEGVNRYIRRLVEQTS
jgi:ADP-L-glycero-D-manno-heptose 6-epimerase